MFLLSSMYRLPSSSAPALRRYDHHRGRGKEQAVYGYALRIDPGNVVANNQMGTLRMRERKYDEALVYLDRALRTDHPFPVTLLNKAITLTISFYLSSLLLKMGQPARAETMLQQAARPSPGPPAAAAKEARQPPRGAGK